MAIRRRSDREGPSPAPGRVAGRRGFFRRSLVELAAAVESIGGRPHLRLTGLDAVPAPALRRMCPVFFPAAAWKVEAGQLWARRRAAAPLQPVQPAGEEEALALALFDGAHTVEDVGAALGLRFGGEREAWVARASEIFLAVARLGLCHPAGPGPGGAGP